MNQEKILIVEDERIIAFDLQRRLRIFGYDVLGTCASGEEALEFIKTQKPDMVLMDIMLQGDIDGIQTSKLFLEQGIPSIFITAYSDPATLERAKVAQPLAYIIKPFKERELFSTLDMAFYKYRIDNKLKDQEKLLSAILSSVGDGIMALDQDLKIQYLNPAMEDLLKMPEAQVIGKAAKNAFSLMDEDSLLPLTYPSGESSERVVPQFFKGVLLKNAEGNITPVEGCLSQVKMNHLPYGLVIALRDVSSLRSLTQQLDSQSKIDNLTGLMNRKEFMEQLNRAFQTKTLVGLDCSLVYFDLDRFKLVNDTCGPQAGDGMLKKTAELLVSMKDQNTLAIGRIGGDEFAVLYSECTPAQGLERAWMIKHQLNGYEFKWQNARFKLQASIGVLALTKEFDDVKSLLAAADDACSLAQEEGGNRIKVFDSQEIAFQKRRGDMTWINLLNSALEFDRFKLYGQPIMPISNNSGLRPKVELLIRLISETGEVIMPDMFIPSAERYNIMPQIDRWVIRNAVAAYAKLDVPGDDKPMYCINLSAESIADQNLVSFIKHEFKKNAVLPQDFCFEITETATIDNMNAASLFVTELKTLGCRFALDDFGSGFSSFSYLKNLPIDYLKIDGSFIKTIDQDQINYAMVEAMYKIGRVMDLKIIAEFVSSEAILQKLEKIGIDYAQGFAIGKPLPIN